MKKFGFITCLFLLSNNCSSVAQSIPFKLDSLLRKTLDDQRISLNVKGLSAAIQFSDNFVWSSTSGVSSQNPNVLMDTTQVLGIASISKTVTAACILQMADEGLLHLDDSLHQWLDTFTHINPNITIRQLLRHQSGIYDVVTAPDFQPVLIADQDSIWALADVIKTFIQPPYFQAGAAWRYSNTNYLLLGIIAEKVAGKPYYQAFRDRFLAPLGLPSFSMRPFETIQNDIAHPWIDLNGDGTVDDAFDLLYNWHSFDAASAPAGSYYAKASDLARWIKAFGGGLFLSDTMLTQATTTVNTAFPSGTRYGLGLMERSFLTHKAYGHGGDFGYSGSAWYFPGLDKSIVVLNNDARKNSWQIATAVQALLKTILDYETALDVPEVENTFNIKIFPNPFSDHFIIQTALSFDTIRIGSLSGQIVRNLTSKPYGTETFRCELGDNPLPPGVYTIELFDGKKRQGAAQIISTSAH